MLSQIRYRTNIYMIYPYSKSVHIQRIQLFFFSVSVISSDPPCIKGNTRFTTVLFKSLCVRRVQCVSVKEDIGIRNFEFVAKTQFLFQNPLVFSFKFRCTLCLHHAYRNSISLHKYICAIKRTNKGFNGTAVNRALSSFNFIYYLFCYGKN